MHRGAAGEAVGGPAAVFVIEAVALHPGRYRDLDVLAVGFGAQIQAAEDGDGFAVVERGGRGAQGIHMVVRKAGKALEGETGAIALGAFPHHLAAQAAAGHIQGAFPGEKLSFPGEEGFPIHGKADEQEVNEVDHRFLPLKILELILVEILGFHIQVVAVGQANIHDGVGHAADVAALDAQAAQLFQAGAYADIPVAGGEQGSDARFGGQIVGRFRDLPGGFKGEPGRFHVADVLSWGR